MERTLHAVPRLKDVVREQIRVVTLALRPVAMVAAMVFGFLTVVIVADMIGGNAGSWFDAGEASPILLFAFLLPFAVWRTEKQYGPSFLWTLPVDRRLLALAKVFAGWVWLITAVAMVIAWHRLLALLSGVSGTTTISPVALIGATTAYLFGSAFVLGLRHPLRWLFGAGSIVLIVGMLREATRGPRGTDAINPPARFEAAFAHAETLWLTLSQPAHWTIATIVSVLAGLAALWAALSRHRERRRD
ncbi:MAG: hypothetical protein M3Q69_15840 [Acidobacteriota bacterium]|nr:hypothetical protein [Acidobacteriota bacterium]